jgi:tetratricopeptide (TPR) repeat protein
VLTSDGQVLHRFPAQWLKSALQPGYGLWVGTPGTTTWRQLTDYPWCGCYWHDPTPTGRDQPTVKELTEELEKLAAVCRTLAEGRRDIAAGRFEPAIATFRALIAGGGAVPEAIRQSAQREVDGLVQKATGVLTEAEKLLALKAYRRAWDKAAPLEGQGLVNVSGAISARFQALKEAVEANTQARPQQSQVRPAAVSSVPPSPEGEAQQWLVLGNNYLANRMYAQAIEQYTKVIEKHPDTPAAAEARTKLEQARTQAAEKKPAEGATKEP